MDLGAVFGLHEGNISNAREQFDYRTPVREDSGCIIADMVGQVRFSVWLRTHPAEPRCDTPQRAR
jgi:hypothetical protein